MEETLLVVVFLLVSVTGLSFVWRRNQQYEE